MNLMTLCKSIAVALERDETLNSYVSGEFAKKLAIYVGIDNRHPLGIDEAPLVAVHPRMKSVGGMEDDIRTNTIYFAVAVKNENKHETTGQQKELPGLAQVNKVYEYVRSVISGKTFLDDVDADDVVIPADNPPLEHFPLFLIEFDAVFYEVLSTQDSRIYQ